MRTHADSVRISHLCPEAQMQVRGPSEKAPIRSAKGNREWKYSGEGSGMLHPEFLLLWQSTADPFLHRRHLNTVLSQSVWGLWVLVCTRLV